MAISREKPTLRDAQRRATRRRVYKASITEFKRSGMAGADISAIVAAARVARGTFYLHYPTKEHVLEELQREVVARIADDLNRFLRSAPRDLSSVLSETVRLVVAYESRLGTRLFRDVLSLYFSSTRPPSCENWSDHAVVSLLGEEIDKARQEGLVRSNVNASQSALFFLLGIYSLLVNVHSSRATRSAVLDDFITSTRWGLEVR